MRGVIYARYSEGPKQTDQSIEGQVAECTEYAERNKITIVDVYADRHISGKSIAGREAFQQMLRDAGDHLFDCVIVWKVDRFGRSREDIAISKMKLKKAGVKLLYARENVPDGPEGILLEAVMEGLAEYYSEDLRQKVIRGIRENAKKGKYSGGTVIIGYKLVDKHVVVDEPAAAVVREAFRRFSDGEEMTKLVKLFSQRGIKTSRGSYPTKSTLYRMFRNRRYIGEWEMAGIKLDVPGIVDEELFMSVQKNFKTTRNVKDTAAEYLLSGKCFCGQCGSLMVGETGTSKTGKTYHYYKCSGRKRKKTGCKMQPIPQYKLEDAVLETTLDRVLQPEMIDYMVEKIMELDRKRHELDPAAAMKTELAAIKKKKQKLIDSFASDLLSESEFREQIVPLREREQDLQAAIDKTAVLRPLLPEKLVRGWLEQFAAEDIHNKKFRRKLCRTFIARIDIMDETSALVWYNVREHGSEDLCSDKFHLVD